MLLQQFKIQFAYTPGKQNVMTDTLFRPSRKRQLCIENYEYNFVSIDFPRKGSNDFSWPQESDPELSNIIRSFKNDNQNVLLLISKGYMIIDGVLYRYCADEDSESCQLVLPDYMRSQLLSDYHNDATAAHMGIEKTISRISPHFYWLGMRTEITNYVKACIES